jgi:cation diffusion facilitator family transporter
MHDHELEQWRHDHVFAQDRRKPGESRTRIVIAITAAMMLIEIAAGLRYGSMALLADGLHMASHAVALSITAVAYLYARRNAGNRRFSFGTGKVNALGGFTGAVLLAVFALFMAIESIGRLLHPIHIVFDQAILVAVAGLAVNGISALILGAGAVSDAHHDHDHNLKSAYLHVLADALTSITAIVALLAAKYFGFVWMDPIMGIVGSILVARWSFGLLGTTASVLLDRQAPENLAQAVKNALEADQDTRVTDLHVWSIGPKIFSALISVVAHDPATPAEYKSRIPDTLGLVHVSIEIQECPSAERSERVHAVNRV